MKIVLPPLCLVWLAVAAHSPAAQADPVRLHIVGPDNMPVAKAQVRIAQFKGFSNLEQATVADLVTDEAGDIGFESKGSLESLAGEKRYLEQNGVIVRVLAPGLAATIKQLVAGDNEVTMKLGRAWGGQVFDEAQKPLEGVRVVLGYPLEKDQVPQVYPRSFRLESVTNAEGRWSCEGIPLSGQLPVWLLDPRYVHELWALPLDAPSAPPIFLERGATIKGRLVQPDGKGAGNVPLYPGSSDDRVAGEGTCRTASDGTFEISGLPTGDYYLQQFGTSLEKPQPFIVEPLTIRGLTEGEVRDIGDWKTKGTIRITGNVVANSNKKPIAGARISIGWGTQGTRSDAKGAFTLFGPEDGQSGPDNQVAVSAPGFMTQLVKPPPPVNGAADLGTVSLKPGGTITGKVEDKGGRSAPFISVLARDGKGESFYGYSDQDAKFSFDGLPTGTYTLTARGYKLLGETKVSVVVGQQSAPLTLRLDAEKASSPYAQQMVQGQATDDNGNPVAGAAIVIIVANPEGYNQPFRALSGLDGRFATSIRAGSGVPKSATARRPGHTFVRADEFKLVDGVWQTALVLQPKGLALRGEVVDSQGKPVAGAAVALFERTDLSPVLTDENGIFSLPDVPLQGVTVLASNGQGFGQTKIAKAGDKAQVALQETAGDPTSEAEATALADEILPTASLGYLSPEQWNSYWELLGVQRLQAAAAHAKNDGIWMQYLELMARRAPASFLTQSDELLKGLTKVGIEVEALVARTQARSEDPAQRAKAQAWLGAHARPQLDMTGATVSNLLHIATVAEALQKGDSARWVEFAAQVAAQLPDKTRLREAELWGSYAASLGPAALDNFSQEWGGNTRFRVFQGATQALINGGEVEKAAAMLKQLEATVPEAETGKDRELLEEWERTQRPNDSLRWMRASFAMLMSKTDPAAALAMVPNVDEYSVSALQLEVARNIVEKGQTEGVPKLLRQMFDSPVGSPERYPEAARIAGSFDAKLADELFLMAWKRLALQSRDVSGQAPSLARYAMARAKNWPGESRVLIEREWAQRLPAFDPKDNRNAYQNAGDLKDLVAAMAIISPRRALEMAAQLPTFENTAAEGRGLIAVKLLERK